MNCKLQSSTIKKKHGTEMDDSGEEIFILLFLKSDPTLNKDKEDTSLTVTLPKR